MHDLDSLLPGVLDIAHAAGKEIMAVYAGEFSVEQKADRTPLTQADLRSQQRIIEGLKRLTPDIPILAEESATVPWSERQHWRDLWLVDPLDGTREFVSRNPEFTVNIAYIRDHRPVLGVVHVPAQAVDYYGCESARGGHEAFRRTAGSPPRALKVTIPARKTLRVVGSKSHRGDSLDDLLTRLGPHELKPIGSSLKLCLVAAGEADFYPRLGPTMEWDTAAAQAVAECAGARVVDLEGSPLRYNARETLTNPHFLAYADPAHDWLRYVRGPADPT